MTTMPIQVRRTHKRQPFLDCSTYNGHVTLQSGDPTFNVGDWELEGQLESEQGIHAHTWANPTIEAMLNLTMTDIWTSGGMRTQPAAVVSILRLLLEILDDHTPPPGVVPTWDGGVQVEWHRNNVDFEIESDPHGAIEYFFKDTDEEREGRVWDDFGQLAKYVQAVNVSE